MKVVFDTNIYVSAFTLPGGRGAQALERIIDGRDSLALSRSILDEILSMLSRKFARDREELARVALWLAELTEIVGPDVQVDALDDSPQNRILECAIAAGAEVIVTGDRAMLDLGAFRGVQIVSLSGDLDKE